MGKYTNLTREYLEQVRPVLEERVGVNLDDVIIKEGSKDMDCPVQTDLKERLILVGENYLKKLAQKVRRDYTKPFRERKKELISKYGVEETREIEKSIKKGIEKDVRGTLDYNIQDGTLHEISHIIHAKLLLKKIEELNADAEEIIKKYERMLDEENHEFLEHSFLEGFALYMAFDHLRDIYDIPSKDLESFLDQHRKEYMVYDEFRARVYELDDDPYEKGYRFFKEVLSVVGEDKIFEVASTIPLSKEEILKPKVYLLRAFPMEVSTSPNIKI